MPQDTCALSGCEECFEVHVFSGWPFYETGPKGERLRFCCIEHQRQYQKQQEQARAETTGH